MKRRSLLLIAAFLSLPIHAQQTFQVLEIFPSSGPSTGGTEVRIRFNSLPNCPILAPPPTVRFGDTMVEVSHYDGDNMVVTTPAHAPGLVDVTVDACGLAEPIIVPRGFAFFGQTNPTPLFRVLSVTPAFGPTSGGTEVTIQLDDIPFCSDPIPPEGVTFGGVDATNVRADFERNTITAVTPAVPAGSVELRVTTCGGPTETITSGFTFTNAAPNPNPAFEKVLFPVLFFGPGARGSQWNTKISVYNAGDGAVTSGNAVFEGNPMCPRPCGCDETAEIFPQVTAVVCTVGFSDPAGLIYYAPRVAADDLHYHARIFDTSRSTMNAGTEIPVVREREFRTDEILLLDVPLDGTPAQIDNILRVTLRVYNPDQIDGAQVRMSFLDPGSPGVIGEEIITLSYPTVSQQGDYPNRPSFVFINNLQEVVRRGVPAEVPLTSFHVRLTPVDPDVRIWAFASITNNETQLVTTITPQR